MPSTSPFFVITLFFMAGIIMQTRWHIPLSWLGAGAVSALLLGWIFSSRRIVSMVLICTAFLFIGAVYLEVHRILPADHINRISWAKRKAPIEVTGVVASDVQNRLFFRGKKTTFTLEVKHVKPEGWRREDRQGKILVNIFRDEPLAYGDLIVLTGKLHRPFEFSNDSHFSYRNYLEQRGVKFILSVGKKGSAEVVESGQGNRLTAFSLSMKRRLSKVLDDHLSPVEAALVTGMVLGDRYGIPEHIRELFVQTGTAHILAISGFNVGIVAFLFFLFLKMIPISRKVQYVITMVFLVFYAFLVGAQPSVAATRRRRAATRAISLENDIKLKGYFAFEAGETINPWITQRGNLWEPYASFWDEGWIAAKNFHALPKEEQDRIKKEQQEVVDAYVKRMEERRIQEIKDEEDRLFWQNVNFASIFIPLGVMTASVFGYGIYTVSKTSH